MYKRIEDFKEIADVVAYWLECIVLNNNQRADVAYEIINAANLDKFDIWRKQDIRLEEVLEVALKIESQDGNANEQRYDWQHLLSLLEALKKDYL